MKIGFFEITFGAKKKREITTTAPRRTPRTASATKVEQKSGWASLWPIAMEWLMFRNQSLDKPFAQNPQVYKAISAIASNVAQAEIAFYREGTNEEVEDRNLSDLLYRPNKYESWNDFIESVAGHFAASGECFIVMEKSIGQVTGTRRLPAELWVDASSKFEEIIDRNTGKLVAWKYDRRRLELDEVIQCKTFNLYNRYRGANPMEVMNGEIQLDFKALLYNQRFMDNDATPSFILSTDKNLTEDQRKRLTEWAEKRNKGTENAGKMSIFDGGLKPEVLSKSHKDMEFSAQREFAREEILGAWKTPKALFNITEQLNYATFTGQMKIFWIYTLIPIMRKIEEGINKSLVEPYNPGIYFAFKLDNVPAFQDDFKDKVVTAKTLFDMGFTANEINQKLNLGFEEKDWRDYWWIGFGQVPADSSTASEARDAASATAPADDSQKSTVSLVNLKTWQGFVSKQAPIESRFKKVMKTYFFQIRSEVLKRINEGAKDIEAVASWGGWDDEIKKVTRPLLHKSVEDGVEIGKSLVGQKSVMDDIIAQRVEALVAVRANKITGINRTLKKNIKAALEAGIAAGGSPVQLSDAVREVFNTTERRSFVIARTETAGAVNAGSNLYYAEAGIEKKRWVTAGDELVRESHRSIDGETQFPEDKFSNGLNYPGDQEANDASEVVNCRCTISPVV